MGCFVFFRRPSSLGYNALTDGEDSSSLRQEMAAAAPAVMVVAGKEKREFLVDPFVLEREPLRMIMDMSSRKLGRVAGGIDAVFVDVDAIFFEHMLWSVYNDFSSNSYSSSPLFQHSLKEIIEFYSQDHL